MGFENNTIEQQRKQFEEGQNARAKERNKNRTLLEKMAFKGRVSGLDIAKEEADEMGGEAEELLKNGDVSTLSEAVEELNAKEKYLLKDKEQIRKEEYVRAKALKVIEKMEAGELDKAFELLSKGSLMAVDYDEETKRMIGEYVTPFVRIRAVEDIKNKNVDDLIELLSGRLSTYSPNVRENIPFITADDLNEISINILKSPEIIARIQNYLVDRLKNAPNVFHHVLKRFVDLGFVTKEEVISLPKIKEVARVLLVNCPLQREVYTDSPGSQLSQLFQQRTFDELNEIFTGLGILDEIEIEQIRSERLER